MNQMSKRLTQKVVQVFNRLNNSNPFLGTVLYVVNKTVAYDKGTSDFLNSHLKREYFGGPSISRTGRVG